MQVETTGSEKLQPSQKILEAIADKSKTQTDIAILYAELIHSFREVNWPIINQAIQSRWTGKTALERVKEMAHKIVPMEVK